MRILGVLTLVALAGCAPPVEDDVATSDALTAEARDVLRQGLLTLTSRCDQVASAGLYKTDADSTTEEIAICGLPGAFFWRADMDIDCDGGRSTACRADPDYQAETATTDSHDRPVDASTVPYIVVPGASTRFDHASADLRLGAIAAVLYRGQMHYGVLADVGPPDIIGEASAAMARMFGIEDDPVNGGTDAGDLGVTYVVFRGADAVVDPIESRAAAIALGDRKLAELLAPR